MYRPYSRYAAIYDRTGQHRFSEVMTALTLEWLARRHVSPGTALDLATGTGAAALALSRHGIRTTGIDSSVEMLACAREKAAGTGPAVTWQQSDMRTFTVASPVDLVTCFFDSINYLLREEDLLACFSAVCAALRPGGWFVFDMNPIHRYATDWNDSADIAYSDNRLLCLFRSNFDPETHLSPLILTVFEREDVESDVWRGWEETHVERGYPLHVIDDLLSRAGLCLAERCALDEKEMQLSGPATETSMRAVYFVRKPGPGGKIPA